MIDRDRNERLSRSRTSGLCVAAGRSIAGDPGVLDYERPAAPHRACRFCFFPYLPQRTESLCANQAVLALRPRRRQLGITFGIAYLCRPERSFTPAPGNLQPAADDMLRSSHALLGVHRATSNTPAARTLGKLWRPTYWVASYALFVGFYDLPRTAPGVPGALVYLLPVSPAPPGPPPRRLLFVPPPAFWRARRFFPALSTLRLAPRSATLPRRTNAPPFTGVSTALAASQSAQPVSENLYQPFQMSTREHQSRSESLPGPGP